MWSTPSLGPEQTALLLAALWLTVAAVAADTDATPEMTAAPGTALQLQYRGFVAGAPIGEAAVTVAVHDGAYRVSGDARSNGVLAGFSRWRNRFSARGRLDGAQRRPEEFSYLEQDRDKTRRVLVRDGELQVTKNGKQRPTRQAPAFPDVISALFVQPHCRGDQQVHTGRHVYRLSRLERDPGGCRYAVIDDDDDSFEMELVLVRRGGLVVPKKITVYGWLTGWIELQQAVEAAGRTP